MSAQNKDVVFNGTDSISIQSVSDDLSALYFGSERVILSNDAILDLTYRLASYVAFLETQENSIDSLARPAAKESCYLH